MDEADLGRTHLLHSVLAAGVTLLEVFTEMIDKSVHSKLIALQDLPTLPEVMAKILESVADETTSADDIARLLASDHAISARILRLANSAFYALRNPVDSINRAVVVIGFDSVKNLALATSLFDAFMQRNQMAFDPTDFWLHSLGAAKAAKIIVSRHHQVESSEGCFTAGLLHDIGKYVLALVLKEEYKIIVMEARSKNLPLRKVEESQINTSHTDVGNWLAERWRFPEMITDAIANLYRLTDYEGPFVKEVATVAVADQVSRLSGFGHAADGDTPAIPEEALDVLDLELSDAEKVCEELEESLEETQGFLQSMKR